MKLPKDLYEMRVNVFKNGKRFAKKVVKSGIDEKDARFQVVQDSLKNDEDVEILNCKKVK